MRPIDADAFAAEMKKRQDGCQWRLDNPVGDVFYTEREHWTGVLAAFAEAKIILNTMPTIGGWISVKERMPEPPAQCLVYSDKRRPRGMETATYTEFGWMTAAYFPEITHWMPLPEPPEGGERG